MTYSVAVTNRSNSALVTGARSIQKPSTVDEMRGQRIRHAAALASHPERAARNPDHALRRGRGAAVVLMRTAASARAAGAAGV